MFDFTGKSTSFTDSAPLTGGRYEPLPPRPEGLEAMTGSIPGVRYDA